jgi:hypothetical protein
VCVCVCACVCVCEIYAYESSIVIYHVINYSLPAHCTELYYSVEKIFLEIVIGLMFDFK